MCCRTFVYPLDIKTVEAILKAGLFVPEWKPPNSDFYTNWVRQIPEEGTAVHAFIMNDSEPRLELNISPAISVYGHHKGKRLAASVYFEIAAKYAEKVNGEIIQQATVMGCKNGDESKLVLASYPSHHLSYDRICNGFKELFLGEQEL